MLFLKSMDDPGLPVFYRHSRVFFRIQFALFAFFLVYFWALLTPPIIDCTILLIFMRCDFVERKTVACQMDTFFGELLLVLSSREEAVNRKRIIPNKV